MPPPMNPLQNIRVATKGGAADFAEQGRRTVQAQLKGSTLAFGSPSKGGNTTPVNVTNFAPPTKGGSSTPGLSVPGATSTADVLKTANALATEDTIAPFPVKETETVTYERGPDGVVRPTLHISGANWVGDQPTMGSAAPPPPPKDESYTSPPLVSAPPTKKSSAWLWLAVAAAVAAVAS